MYCTSQDFFGCGWPLDWSDNHLLYILCCFGKYHWWRWDPLLWKSPPMFYMAHHTLPQYNTNPHWWKPAIHPSIQSSYTKSCIACEIKRCESLTSPITCFILSLTEFSIEKSIPSGKWVSLNIVQKSRRTSKQWNGSHIYLLYITHEPYKQRVSAKVGITKALHCMYWRKYARTHSS